MASPTGDGSLKSNTEGQPLPPGASLDLSKKFLAEAMWAPAEAEYDIRWVAFGLAAKKDMKSFSEMSERKQEFANFIAAEIDRMLAARVYAIEESATESTLKSNRPLASTVRVSSGAGIGAVAFGVVVGGVAVVALPAVLTAIGFTSAGVAAGSVAAAWQATYGGAIASGSLFAACQSMGALGVASTAAIATAGGGGAAVGAVVGGTVAATTAGRGSDAGATLVTQTRPADTEAAAAVVHTPHDYVLSVWSRALHTAFPREFEQMQTIKSVSNGVQQTAAAVRSAVDWVRASLEKASSKPAMAAPSVAAAAPSGSSPESAGAAASPGDTAAASDASPSEPRIFTATAIDVPSQVAGPDSSLAV